MATQLILVGGFLGAGKTTLLLAAAKRLIEQGRRVGLVTNDQGQDLVDTTMAHQQGLPVAEVAGGCFCCRFPDLLSSIRQLEEHVKPDVILAEPVGSCTDLVATVLRPLQHYYPGQFGLAPLTILLDPQREPAHFPATVRYLYQKQLDEADILVVSKRDLLDPAVMHEQLATLTRAYPDTQVLSLSARSGEGLDRWLERSLTRSTSIARHLDLDYATYADAEACLGWLNARISLAAGRPFLAANWLECALHALQQACSAHGASIAHLKAHLMAPALSLKASVTQADHGISWDVWTPDSQTDQAQVILNARVNCDPCSLETLIRQVVLDTSLQDQVHAQVTQLESFSPLPPKPTYRLNPDMALLSS